MCPIIEIIEMFLCTVTEQYITSMLEMNVLVEYIAYSTVYYDSTKLMPFNNVYCICYVEQKRTFKT